jgi:hypothetical protein
MVMFLSCGMMLQPRVYMIKIYQRTTYIIKFYFADRVHFSARYT